MLNGGTINGYAVNATPGAEPILVSALHTTGWNMPISALHASEWIQSVAAVHAAPIAFVASALHTSFHDLLGPISALHLAPSALNAHDDFEVAFAISAGYRLEQVWELSGPLLADVERAFGLSAPLNTGLESAFVLSSELPSVDTLERAFVFVMPLPEGSPLVATGAITLSKDGSDIALAPDSSISLEEGDHAWKGRLVLANAADAELFAFDDALAVDIDGAVFNLLVDTRTVSRRGPGQTLATIGVIGPAARYAAPRAQPFSNTYNTAQSAKAIVESLIGTVDWRVDDWIIPANRLGVEEATPMETAKRIATATGAVIEANPDGSLYVRYRYPVPLAQYPSAMPDHVFYEADSVFSREEPYQFFEQADRLRITDIEAATFGDRIEFVADEANGLAGQLHVFPSPWREIDLRHTGPQAIALSQQGDVALEKTERIEIVAGRGQLGYPIQSITQVEWEVVDLGTLIFTPGSTSVESTSTTDTESLATVTYTTLAKVWDTASPVEDVVQFVVS